MVALAPPARGKAPRHPEVRPYEAIAFIGFAGKGESRVEIWEVETPWASSANVSVHAFDRKKRQWVGGVFGTARAFNLYPHHIDSECGVDLELLGRVHGTPVDRAVHLSGAFLLSRLHGMGIGVALYLAFAALARKRGYAVVADGCFRDSGSTSPEARRVWASKEFRRHVDVGPASGLVGVYIIR